MIVCIMGDLGSEIVVSSRHAQPETRIRNLHEVDDEESSQLVSYIERPNHHQSHSKR